MNLKEWEDIAAKLLVGRKIVKVRYMTNEELEVHDWNHRAVVIQLDNGLLIYPSADDEGNNAGALFTTDEKTPVLPVLVKTPRKSQTPEEEAEMKERWKKAGLWD